MKKHQGLVGFEVGFIVSQDEVLLLEHPVHVTYGVLVVVKSVSSLCCFSAKQQATVTTTSNPDMSIT
jgi:hypothetical protein